MILWSEGKSPLSVIAFSIQTVSIRITHMHVYVHTYKHMDRQEKHKQEHLECMRKSLSINISCFQYFLNVNIEFLKPISHLNVINDRNEAALDYLLH